MRWFIDSHWIIRGIVFALMVSLIPVSSMANNASRTNVEQISYPHNFQDKCYQSSTCYSVTVGSEDVRPDRLSFYNARWTQQVLKEGRWIESPASFIESMRQTNRGHWLHVQEIHSDKDIQSRGSRVLDRHTFRLLSLTLELKQSLAKQPVKVHYDMSGTQFFADAMYVDGKQKKGKLKELPIPMFDGQIAGLTIAALPLAMGYSATMPMIIPNMGTYWLKVEVVGRESRKFDNELTVDLWEVNAHWLNLTDGEVYPGGRNKSGGTYYISVNAIKGVPPVIEYANNGAIISWDGVLGPR